MKKGPYGQYLRIRRICTLDSDFKLNADKLASYYLNRGYPLKQLKNHHKRVAKLTQKELLIDEPKQDIDTPPVMVTRFNPMNRHIKKFIHSNWNNIQHCEELKRIFTQKPLIGFRRLPNLKDILSSNKITYPPTDKTLVIDKLSLY